MCRPRDLLLSAPFYTNMTHLASPRRTLTSASIPPGATSWTAASRSGYRRPLGRRLLCSPRPLGQFLGRLSLSASFGLSGLARRTLRASSSRTALRDAPGFLARFLGPLGNLALGSGPRSFL